LQLHRLMTATTSLLVRELGTPSSKMQSQVQARLYQLFDLSESG
jgi:hypothetical protein